MDSHLWHAACMRPGPPEPDCHTAAGWSRMTAPERETRVAELRRWLNNLYVDTAGSRAVASQLSAVVDENSETGPGAKLIASVTGVNMLGKSTAVRQWATQQYLEWISHTTVEEGRLPTWKPNSGVDADLCPVVWLNLQSAAMVKGFNSQILDFFGLTVNGAAHRMSTIAVRALARHGARAVVIDDVQLLKTNWKGGREVLDHVKYINTELGEFNATLILVGTNLRSSAIMSDPQIAGRLQSTELTPHGIDTLDDQADWQRVLSQFETSVVPHLPRAKEGDLTSKFAGLIWKRTQGYVGDTSRLIIGASSAAIADGAHTLRREHIEAVRLSDRAHEAEVQIERKRPLRRS